MTHTHTKHITIIECRDYELRFCGYAMFCGHCWWAVIDRHYSMALYLCSFIYSLFITLPMRQCYEFTEKLRIMSIHNSSVKIRPKALFQRLIIIQLHLILLGRVDDVCCKRTHGIGRREQTSQRTGGRSQNHNSTTFTMSASASERYQ